MILSHGEFLSRYQYRLGNIVKPVIYQQTTDSETSLKTIPVAAEEAIQIDHDYENRIGYDPSFLPGVTVPLPTVPTAMKRNIAQRLQVNHGDNPYELKYQHFSIIINAKRRMALITAVNIDGSKWIRVDRRTGEPTESIEAGERWFEDPRIESAGAMSSGSVRSSNTSTIV